MHQWLRCSVVVLALAAGSPALADGVVELETPEVEKGEAEIEFNIARSRDAGRTREDAASVAVGYGITRWWASEAGLVYRRADGASELEAFEWENKFKLADADVDPVGAALLLEVERPRESGGGWEVTVGPLLQSELGRFVLNANVLFEKTFRATGEVEREWETQYQWQARYRVTGTTALGLHGFADDETASAGPVLFGELSLGDETLKYNVGWLKGLNDRTAAHTLRAQIEFEFE